MDIEISNLTTGYRGRAVIDGLNAGFYGGRINCILGENGSGKSTLLKAIDGTLPYKGSIRLDGRELNGFKRIELSSLVSMLSQFSYAYFSYTVRETVMMGRYRLHRGLFSGASREDMDAVSSCMEQTGIRDIANERIGELSGGQLQRVYLAQTFVQDTDCILLDEPLNHLDLKYQALFLSYIRDWVSKDDSHTVIGVFHDLRCALDTGSHFLVLKEGRSLFEGGKEELFVSGVLNDAFSFDVMDYLGINPVSLDSPR